MSVSRPGFRLGAVARRSTVYRVYPGNLGHAAGAKIELSPRFPNQTVARRFVLFSLANIVSSLVENIVSFSDRVVFFRR